MKWLGKYLLMGWLCWMMVNCSSSSIGDENGDGGGGVSFVFQMIVDGDIPASLRTRTAMGANFDSRIKKGTLHIFIYEGEQQIGVVEQLKYDRQPDVNGGMSVYYVQGVSSVPLLPGKTYRLLFVANVDDISLQTFDGPTFKREDLHYPEGYLPLWGVTSHTVDYQPLQHLAPVNLLRGVAKVMVRLSDSLKHEGFQLKDVVLSDVNPLGYVFPLHWKNANFTNELMEKGDYFHPIVSSSKPVLCPLQQNAENDYFIYIPEYNNWGPNGAADISLSVISGDLEERYEGGVEFKNYREGCVQNGTLHNLVRNHIYEYTIQKVDIGHQLSLKSHVEPWVVDEETWDYTDQVTVRAEGKMQWVKGTYQRIEHASGVVVMVPGNPMVCTFQIDTPKEALWYASFIPISGNPDAFEFETHRLNNGKNAFGKVGQPVVLHIKSVKPAKQENNVALLRIVVVTKGGRTILVKNLLPDDFHEIIEYTLVQSI